MANFAKPAGDRRTGEPAPRLAAHFLLLFLLCLPGCGGCRKTPEAEEKATKKEKPKPPFEARQPSVMPAGSFAGACKPGHWISQVWPDVKANLGASSNLNGDWQGDLQADVVDRADHKMQLPAVLYELTNQRPVALAREQPKALETLIWIPPGEDAQSVDFKLAASGGGPAAIERSMPLSRMPSYRYFFIVLSKPASRYDYLYKQLASIHLNRTQPDSDPGTKYYEVVSMPSSKRPSLPGNALYWTSIAYVLWDDFDPAQFDADQQRALVDWLHWGGQVIVSGPDALVQLQDSFLRPYLPATAGKSRSLSADDLSILQYWAGEVGLPPHPVKPWPSVDLKIDQHVQHAQFLPYSGDLVAERQIGRGRIVVSAFRLTVPELTGWPGFDCFFNACLLRRPARLFRPDQDADDGQFHWDDSRASSHRLDAAKMTAVRYFARDAGVEFAHYASDVVAASEANNALPYRQDAAPGLGAWNDFSPVAAAARTALKNASGITVPERSFIVWVVVGYLLVLVPANWLIFRLVGRVEWAWIAAPLIAVACTAVVIQQAQLNLGFARSQNEIAVIEMQPGYSRVHLAHYTSLYTSLATRYEFRLSDPAGQILPFPAAEKVEMSVFQALGELVCRRGDDTQLTGFNVGSSVLDFVHSEEMADFGGTVTLRRDSDGTIRVTNDTTHALVGCRAIQARPTGAELAKIPSLEPGATAELKFKAYVLPKESVTGKGTQDLDPTGELSVEGIEEVALNHQELRSGEICLVARIVGLVPGLTVTPAARQTRQAAILVAHLDPGQLPEPKADSKEPPASVTPHPSSLIIHPFPP